MLFYQFSILNSSELTRQLMGGFYDPPLRFVYVQAGSILEAQRRFLQALGADLHKMWWNADWFTFMYVDVFNVHPTYNAGFTPTSSNILFSDPQACFAVCTNSCFRDGYGKLLQRCLEDGVFDLYLLSIRQCREELIEHKVYAEYSVASVDHTLELDDAFQEFLYEGSLGKNGVLIVWDQIE